MHDFILVCAVLRYGFGGRAEEGLEPRKALAGLGDWHRGKAIGRCTMNAGPARSVSCLLL